MGARQFGARLKLAARQQLDQQTRAASFSPSRRRSKPVHGQLQPALGLHWTCYDLLHADEMLSHKATATDDFLHAGARRQSFGICPTPAKVPATA